MSETTPEQMKRGLTSVGIFLLGIFSSWLFGSILSATFGYHSWFFAIATAVGMFVTTVAMFIFEGNDGTE